MSYGLLKKISWTSNILSETLAHLSQAKWEKLHRNINLEEKKNCFEETGRMSMQSSIWHTQYNFRYPEWVICAKQSGMYLNDITELPEYALPNYATFIVLFIAAVSKNIVLQSNGKTLQKLQITGTNTWEFF